MKITELLEFDVSSAAKLAGKKLVPGLGFVDAGIRAKDGDYTGAAIGTLGGIAGLIPGGQIPSLGLDAVNQLRDYAQEKGGWGNLAKEVGQSMSDYYGQQGNLIPEDLETLDEQGFLRWLEGQDLHNLSEGGLVGLAKDVIRAGAGKLKNLIKPAEREVDDLRRLDQRVEPGFAPPAGQVPPAPVGTTAATKVAPTPAPKEFRQLSLIDPKTGEPFSVPVNSKITNTNVGPGGSREAQAYRAEKLGTTSKAAGDAATDVAKAASPIQGLTQDEVRAVMRDELKKSKGNIFSRNKLTTAAGGTAAGLGAVATTYPYVINKYHQVTDPEHYPTPSDNTPAKAAAEPVKPIPIPPEPAAVTPVPSTGNPLDKKIPDSGEGEVDDATSKELERIRGLKVDETSLARLKQLANIKN